MLRNEPRDLRGWMHDVEQRLLTLWLENARQWYDMPRAEPPVPPLWLGGPWKPAPEECPCPQCVNVSIDSPYAAGSVWNLHRSSCGEFIGTDDCGNTVSFQRYSSGGAARLTWQVMASPDGCLQGDGQAYYVGEAGSYDTFCETGEPLVLAFSDTATGDGGELLPATITVTVAECSTGSGSGSPTCELHCDTECYDVFVGPISVTDGTVTEFGGWVRLVRVAQYGTSCTVWNGGEGGLHVILNASTGVATVVCESSPLVHVVVFEAAAPVCGTTTLNAVNTESNGAEFLDYPTSLTVTAVDCSDPPPTGSGSGGTGSGSSGSGSGSSGSGSGSGSSSSGSGSSGSGSGSSGSGSGSSGSGSGSSGSGSGSSGSGSGSSGSGSGSSGSGSSGSGSGSGSSGSGSSGSGSGSGGSGSGGSGSGGSGSGGSGSGGSGSGGSGSGSGTGLPCCSDASSQNWTIEAGSDGPPVQGDNATPGTASGTGGDFPNVWCGCGFFGEIGRVFGVSQSPETPLGTLIDTSHLSSGAFNESTLLCSYNMAGGGYLFGQICNLTYDGVFAPPCDVVTWRTMTTAMVIWRSWNIALAQYQYHTLFEFRLHGGPWSPGCGGGPYKLILAQYYKPGCPTDGDVVDLIYQGTLAAADICYFPDTAVLHNF